MNRISTLLGFALGLSALGSAQLSADYVAGQVHVKFSGGANTQALQLIGASTVVYNAKLGTTLVRLPAGMSVTQGVNWFRSRSDVVYADPNYIQRKVWNPNDPMFPTQYAPQLIQAPRAWDLMRGAPTTIIAIVDTGVDYNHEDLVGKIVPGYDYVNNDTDPMDEDAHGTHCAGIAAGNTNNGKGIAGIAPNCSIMPVRVLGPTGGTSEWVANGIIFAADNGAKIISLSLGSGGASTVIQDALKYALSKGSLPIAAAGNHGTTQKFYPAAFPECLSVAAVNNRDQRAGFSAYGDWVQVAAPGAGILSTIPGNKYAAFDGTSMACPAVAGLAGMIKAAAPTYTPAQLRARIESTTDFVGDFVTKGRVNAFKAVPPTIIGGAGFVGAVSAFTKYEGVSMAGSLASIANSDNQYVTVSSQNVLRLGQAASIEATLVSPIAVAGMSTFEISTEVSAIAGVSVHAYAWNYTTGKYEFIKAVPATTTDATHTIALSLPYNKYVNAARTSKVILRGINPLNTVRTPTPFTLKIDRLQVQGIRKS